MKTLIKELASNPVRLVDVIREAEQLDNMNQWPRDSIIMSLAQAYETRNDCGRTEAVQMVLHGVRRMGFSLAIKLWDEKQANNPPLENGR